MKKFLKFSTVFVSLLILTTACVTNSSDKSKSDQKKQIDIDYEALNVGQSEPYYGIPAPEEVLMQLDVSMVDYNDGLLNNPKNFKSYRDLKSQALNMGIYMTELAYITMLEKNEASLDYYQAVQGLSEQLRIDVVISEEQYKRIARNIDNTDSLLRFSSDVYTQIIDYLEDNEKGDVISLISIGAFIETLYLSTSSIASFDPTNQLVLFVADQRFTFENIYHNALIFKGSKNVAETLGFMSELNQIYKSLFEETSQKTDVIVSDENKITLTGGSEFTINEAQFNQLRDLIQKSRNEITKVN